MPRVPADETDSAASSRWWLAWAVVAVVIAGGCVLALRLGPQLTPVLDAMR